MKIDKAIEILDLTAKAPDWVWDDDNRNAIKLGIEALKAIKKMRHYPFPYEILKLPGEDEK